MPCRNGRVTNNRIVFRRGRLRVDVNVGGGTAAETFSFEGNRWFAADRPAASRPQLPVAERGGSYGQDPR